MRFDDGKTMRLYRQTIEDFGLYAGLELSQEQMRQLEEAAGAMSAKMRAIRIVAASSVSKRDLEHRLIAKGEAPSQAKDAVLWMADLHLVDDRKTAEQVVSHCAHKGYGIARAKQALYEKQIPKELWEEALEGYPDQNDAILAYLQEHLDANPDARAKKRVIDALIRKGHSYGSIRKAMEMLSYETDEFPED